MVRPPDSASDSVPLIEVGLPGVSMVMVAAGGRVPLLGLYGARGLAGELLREPGTPSVGCTWSMCTLMPSPFGRDRHVGRDHPHRRGGGLTELGVGQHRVDVRERSVVADLVSQLHGAASCCMPSGRAPADPHRLSPMEDENFVLFGEEGAKEAPAADLRQLPAAPAAARRPAPRVRPAGARRAAVHHHPPGLRALVPAAAARGRDGARRAGRDAGRERRPRPLVRPAPARPDARDRAGAGPAGRRAGDDDAAGLPRVPAAARAGQRLPVGAVPRAGVPLRRQGRGVRRAVPRPHRAEEQRLARRLEEPSLWDGFVHVLGEAGLDTSSDEAITASLRAVAHDRSSYADIWGLAEALLQHDELAAAWRARHVVMVERMIGSKTGHRRIDRGDVPAQPAGPEVLPAAVGPALGAVSSAGEPARFLGSETEVAAAVRCRGGRRSPSVEAVTALEQSKSELLTRLCAYAESKGAEGARRRGRCPRC